MKGPMPLQNHPISQSIMYFFLSVSYVGPPGEAKLFSEGVWPPASPVAMPLYPLALSRGVEYISQVVCTVPTSTQIKGKKYFGKLN